MWNWFTPVVEMRSKSTILVVVRETAHENCAATERRRSLGYHAVQVIDLLHELHEQLVDALPVDVVRGLRPLHQIK